MDMTENIETLKSFNEFLQSQKSDLTSQLNETRLDLEVFKEESENQIKNLLNYIDELEFSVQNKDDELKRSQIQKTELTKNVAKLQQELEKLQIQLETKEQQYVETSKIQRSEIELRSYESNLVNEQFEQEKFYLNRTINEKSEEIDGLKRDKMELEYSLKKFKGFFKLQGDYHKSNASKANEFINSKTFFRGSTNTPLVKLTTQIRKLDLHKMGLSPGTRSGIHEQDKKKDSYNSVGPAKTEEIDFLENDLNRLGSIYEQEARDSNDRATSRSELFNNLDKYQIDNDIMNSLHEKKSHISKPNLDVSLIINEADEFNIKQDKEQEMSKHSECKSLGCFLMCYLRKSILL